LAIFESAGVDEVVVIRFSLEFSKTDYVTFFRDTLVQGLGTKAMVIGENHAFGHDREGHAKQLEDLSKQYGVYLEEVKPLLWKGELVSSTEIRKLLKAGDLAKANDLLGRPYIISGIVVSGDGLGKEFGFPTANLNVPEGKLIPADGVYSAKVKIQGESWPAALSIGERPSIGEGLTRVVEVHLLDFSGDL